MNARATNAGATDAAAGSAALASAVYEGRVRHRRHVPHPHAFHYTVALLYLDLSELERVFEGRRFWSVNRRNLAEFRRSDYLGDAGVALDEAVRERAATVLGRRPAGPIRLLTQPRYFGYVFNPVSFYYCFEPDGTTLDCIVAEITNTPWKERHAYVLPVADAGTRGSAWEWAFDKRFHVSPFLPMDRRYRWRFTAPGEHLAVHMDVLAGEQPDFDATLDLQRRPLDATQLARCLWRLPPRTLGTIAAIHWQAFLIWLRRNPVYDHPGKSRRGST